MKQFAIIPLILFISFWVTPLNADIYTWTDENGVQHYSNVEPPKQAKLIIKSAVFATDEKAVQEKIEAERLELQELELQLVAAKQKLISMKQQAIEEQLEEADRKAREAIERSQEILDDAAGYNGGYDDFRDGGDVVVVTGTPYGDYPYSYNQLPYYHYPGVIVHGLPRRSHFKHRRDHSFRKHPFEKFGRHRFRPSIKHPFGAFQHGKVGHGFNGRGHIFRGKYRAGINSIGNFRGGHRSGGNFRGGRRGSRR